MLSLKVFRPQSQGEGNGPFRTRKSHYLYEITIFGNSSQSPLFLLSLGCYIIPFCSYPSPPTQGGRRVVSSSYRCAQFFKRRHEQMRVVVVIYRNPYVFQDPRVILGKQALDQIGQKCSVIRRGTVPWVENATTRNFTCDIRSRWIERC